MSSDLFIRRIEPEDFAGVTKLLAELGRPRATPETIEAMRHTFYCHVAALDVESLVAGKGDDLVGFCSLHLRERLNFATREAWIPDLIVTEREHGQGVAVALFSRAIEIAKTRGCHRLTLESGYHRVRAHRFYERVGMSDLGKYFVMELV